MEWEYSKENIQPLAQGRRIDNLEAALQHEPDVDQTRRLQQREFETELRTYSGDDPLDIWYQYILWAEQNFPRGGNDGQLETLTEKCCALFRDDVRYVNDVRHLEIWLKCVRRCSDGIEILNYLYSNNIFVGLAEFYINWALEFEKLGNLQRADGVFIEGINRNAQPIDLLKKKQRQFLARMSTTIPDRMMVDDPSDCRLPLSALHGKGKKSKVSNNRLEAQLTRATGALGTVQMSTPKAQVGTTFQVYEDVESESAFTFAQPEKKSTLPINKSSRKENEKRPTKWTEAKFSQPCRVASAPNFAVHVEETYEPEKTPQRINMNRLPLSERKVEKPIGLLADRHEENRNFKMMFCKDKLYNGIEEFSFEELRAARWIKKKKDEEMREKHVQEFFDKHYSALKRRTCPSLNEMKRIINESGTSLPESQRSHLNKLIDALYQSIVVSSDVQHDLMNVAHTTFKENPDASAVIRSIMNADTSLNSLSGNSTTQTSFHAPTPTLQTKAARMEVLNLFNKSLKFGKAEETLFSSICNMTSNISMDEAGPSPAPEDKFLIFQDETAKVLKLPSAETSDEEDKENDPPRDYVQVKTDRPLSGILQLSKNVPFKEKDDDSSDEDSDEEDLSDIVPLNRNEPTETIPLPLDSIVFAEHAKIVSTPRGSQNRTSCYNPPMQTSIMPAPDDGFSIFQDDTGKISKTQPPEKVENVNQQTFPKSMYEVSKWNPRSLSVIDETSKEYRSSSASSGTCSSGTTSALSNTAISKHSSRYSQGRKSIIQPSMLGIEFPEKINPFDSALILQLLDALPRPLNTRNIATFYNANVPNIRVGSTVCLGDDQYLANAKLGEGTYAKVFEMELENLNATSEVYSQYVFKVEKPVSLWELYIVDEIHDRLLELNDSQDVLNSIVSFDRGHIFLDGSILASQFFKKTTVLDFVNTVKNVNQSIPESVVIYFTIELLETVHQLHMCNIIHADIKPDNILLLECPERNPLPTFPSKNSTMMLIDFGRSIDMSLLPPNTTFNQVVTTDEFQCPEMFDGRPWTYQIDTFGLLSTVHCLLFGSYLKLRKQNDVWCISSAIKRYWQANVWKEFFHDFLNIPDCQTRPDLKNWSQRFQQTLIDSGKAKDVVRECNMLMKKL